MPSTLPVTGTLVPFLSTVSRVPVPSADQTFRSVVVYLLPVILAGGSFTLSAARVFAAVGFGIGACFFRCFAAGGAFGFAVGERSSGGRSASRLVCVSRFSCRGELAVDVSVVGGAWSGKATADPVAISATAAPGIATFTMPGRITFGRG
jgi:hypothetical protein